MAASNVVSYLGSISSSHSAEREKTKNWTILPDFDELPHFHEYSGCAWGVWGAEDELGTVNMLTEEVVSAAAKEVKTGQTVCLNWPINFPEKPLFSRRPPHIEVIKRTPTTKSQDDEILINTQSGSQWDGLRHFGVSNHGVFYQNTPTNFFKMGKVPNADPLGIDRELIKYGIHNWAQHGICGRAVFLDLVRFFTKDGDALPYDPWTSHAITVADLEACAQAEGVKFQKADILLLRVGFTKKYYESTQVQKDELREKQETFAGIEQSEDMKRFLWDNHFAAIASDQPALERWPPVDGMHMHQTIIGLWGMPIGKSFASSSTIHDNDDDDDDLLLHVGELFDMERLSEACGTNGRYSFFFTSWPLNILGGCASPPNAAVYF